MKKITNFALKSLKATKEDSVDYLFEDAIVEVDKLITMGRDTNYVGVKNTNVVPLELIQELVDKGYVIHTLDKQSISGRAIDLNLRNPITGRYMTGSSSGTAINVFLDINDIGIGTDGGGSVLNPSLSLNLYSVISPLFFEEKLKEYRKKSTDGLFFSPSLGFISKEISLIKKLLVDIDYVDVSSKSLKVYKTKPKIKNHVELSKSLKDVDEVDLNYNIFNRVELIEELKKFDFDKNILISFEGPVDYLSYGDTITGHYDDITQKNQNLSQKYLSKVVNIMGLSAITVPSYALSTGYLIIFKSEKSHLNFAMNFAENIEFRRSELEKDYYSLERGSKKNEFIKRWIYPHS